MNNKVLIVIPAYNEAENIERVVSNLIENYGQYDYVIINDGSKDNTLEICRRNKYNYINMPINAGLAAGVQTGMLYALEHGYDYALQFDGDGQHNPEYIESMVSTMEKEKCDVCIGSRFVTEKKPKSLRMMGNNIIEMTIRLTTGTTIKDPTSGMRMFNRNMINIMANAVDYGPEPDTIAHMISSGAKVKEIQVTMSDRIAGESYLNFGRSVKYMIHMCFSIIFVQWFRKKIKVGE